VGCPGMDLAARTHRGTQHEALSGLTGDGAEIDPDAPFLLVLQHPVTTEYGAGLEQMTATLHAVSLLGVQALVFWPNVDAGSEEVVAGIRQFRAQGLADRCHFFRNLPAEDFARLLAHCSCIIGNSSAALREGAYLGTPAVSIGTRQQNRECGRNVKFTSHNSLEIAEAVRAQIAHGRYERCHIFGDGSAGLKIAEVLATVDPPVQKSLHYDLGSLVDGVLV
ncbi:MAG: UDP-N-acetylglucosamine 2-epimerase, partial [Acidimicrobiales bacterium]